MGEEGPKITLNTEKEYKNFGKKVGDTLYAGHAPYRIEQFFKELCKELPTTCDSKQIKKISDSILSIYNTKLRAEKEEAQGKKKKKAAQLKGGGGKGYEMNNNPAMINDVLGGGYGDEDDYGDEKAFQKENEGEYDFMWESSTYLYVCLRKISDLINILAFAYQLQNKWSRKIWFR